MLEFSHRLILVGFLFTFLSCAHAPVAPKKEAADLFEPKISGFVDSKNLSEGGTIALVPFKAGSQTEANEETDRLSLMIIKGIKDTLDHESSSIHVVDPETHPKLALQGYIQEFSKPGKVSRMMMRPNVDTISLDGEIWIVANGQRIMSFTAKKKFNPKKEKPMDVAYHLGQGIGNFITSHARK